MDVFSDQNIKTNQSQKNEKVFDLILQFQGICLVTSMVFTTLTIASVFQSSSVHEIGGEQTCLVFWFAGSFYVGHKIIGGFGITMFRFISLIHCTKFFRIGAMQLVKAILIYQSIFYGGK